MTSGKESRTDPAASIQDTAFFDDHFTMCWRRLFHVPIQRVWAAVTVADQLNIWFMPVFHVEAKLGGKCQFTFGGPELPTDDWLITAFDAPKVVEYSAGLYSLRFELEQVDAATRMTLKEHVPPGMRDDLKSQGIIQKLVPGTPWPPGTAAGYHSCMDSAERFFAADLSQDRIAEASASLVAYANLGDKSGLESDPDGWYASLEAEYWEFIRKNCPEPEGDLPPV